MSAIRDTVTEEIRSLNLPEEDDPNTEVDTDGTADAETTDETPDPSSTDEKPDEAADEAGAALNEDDVPKTYFGEDLSAFPAEVRRSVIDAYQERDKFIQQLLREKAAAESGETSKPDEPTTEEPELTDKDLLDALGINPEDDPYAEQTAKVALPLAKLVLQLQDQVTNLSTRTELDSTRQYWTTSLAALETQYGAFPAEMTHEDVMKEAASRGIAEPMDAYWAVVGPARQSVIAEVNKRRAQLDADRKKDTQGTTRPKGQADTSDKPIEAENTKEAVKAAFAQIVKERGYRLEDD